MCNGTTIEAGSNPEDLSTIQLKIITRTFNFILSRGDGGRIQFTTSSCI